MKTVENLISFFKVSEAEKEIIRRDIREENIRRVFYLSLIGIPISILHVILFALHLDHSFGIEYKWRFYILLAHLSIVVLLSPICWLIYSSFIRKKKNVKIAGIGVAMVTAMLLVGGSAVSAIDQLVTNSINPFIATSIISSVVLLIRPAYSVLYYTFSFLVFYFIMIYTQTNPDILISNHVNGLTFTGLGLCLSFIFWKMHLTRLKQHKLIEKQKNEIVENYNKLKFYSEELRESNTTKDKLMSVIAHDLRSPLASLINVTRLLAENFDLISPDEIKTIMVSLNKETELTFESLTNLLLWSKTQRKKLEPVLETINLHQLAERSFHPVKGLFKQKNITCSNNIDKAIHIYADSSMIQSVIKNLLINGIKFTPEGGHISSDASIRDGMCVFSVQDNGIGMKPDVLGKLFKPGMEFTTDGTQMEKGTGLGLQICKEFVELNGGEIWAESEFAKGSTFYFTVPCARQ